ncbi:MAG: nitrile hydratase subunit beta [Rhodoferax sp.]|nr:nitrile hydratase subunit beta [Rhodoferax sp.]
MNGLHDMGGLQCFGPVVAERDEPVFHAPWEQRALALTLAMGATGQWNIDLSRSARESLPPTVYLSSSYYAIWICALEKLMLERGLVDAGELSGDKVVGPVRPLGRVLRAPDVAGVLARGNSSARVVQHRASFAVGERVRASNLHPAGHTRLPRYVRGHVGTVSIVHGAHVFADAHASRQTPPFDDTAHWLYSVEFAARALWGPQADASCSVSVDAWEPYLEAAE